MAIPAEHVRDVSFPRPLPRPAFFGYALWVATCGLAYWTYFQATEGVVSVALSVGFWTFMLAVIPFIVRRSQERRPGLLAATLTLLGYVLLMQDALK